MGAARQAEPQISERLKGLAASTGGSVERFGTRFKSRESVLEKLERFRKPTAPIYRLGKFNDALRYTITYRPAIYWASASRAIRELEAVGYRVVNGVRGWFDTGYKGINLTVRSPQSFDFEVQFHTPASLAMAEKTHGIYQEIRNLPQGSVESLHLRAESDRLWTAVPVPPGVPCVLRR